MIYCSVKYCCSNSSIPGVILHSIMKSIKIPNHPAYHWSTLWPPALEVWVRWLYNSWWFCVHKLSMFIYLSMFQTEQENSRWSHTYVLYRFIDVILSLLVKSLRIWFRTAGHSCVCCFLSLYTRFLIIIHSNVLFLCIWLEFSPSNVVFIAWIIFSQVNNFAFTRIKFHPPLDWPVLEVI